MTELHMSTGICRRENGLTSDMPITSHNLFHDIISHELGREPASVKILDFGCGAGGMVKELLALGYDTYGCDIGADWPDTPGEWERGLPGKMWEGEIRERLAPITASPYSLPYPDRTFDVVVSTEVFEHVQNKEEAFAEIARVLKVGGLGIHIFPSKWAVIEPHIYVPFASWMWPNVPDWWLSIWALLGVRNEYQNGMHWRGVVAKNRDYCREGLHYWRLLQYQSLFRNTFGDIVSFDRLRLRFGRGRVARLTRALRLGWIICPMRAMFSQTCIGHHNAGSLTGS
jgi:SAM-dependent methyltransferase